VKSAARPENEVARLASLRAAKLLDTAAEREYDDVVTLAAKICGTPIALVSLVDDQRQWFKARVGLDATETPRDVAFCAHAILEDEVFIVGDAQQDDRFFDNTLVTSGPHVRFYAGAQLRAPDGNALGTLCVIDRVPRSLDAEQRAALEALARQVTSLISLRSQADELRDANRRLAKAARDLAQSEERFRLLVEQSTEMIIRYAPDGKRLYVSPASRELLGYEPEEMLGQIGFEIVHPDDAPAVMAAYARALGGENLVSVAPYRSRRKDGRYGWFETSVRVVRDEAGAVLEMQATTRDVSARKRSERLLEAQHTMTRVLAESDALEQATPLVVETMCRAAGCDAGVIWEVDTPEGLLRCAGVGGLHAADAADLRARTQDTKIAYGEGPLGRVWATATASWGTTAETDGEPPRSPLATTRELRAVFALPLLVSGAVVGLVEIFGRTAQSTNKDVRATVEALCTQIGSFLVRLRARELEHRLVRVLETTSDFVGIADGRGRSIYLNRAGRRLLEIPEAAPITDYRLEEYQPEWANTFLKEVVVPRAMRDGTWSGEFSYRTTSGREIPVSQVTIAERRARGTIAFFASVARDITEMKKVEKLKSEFVSTVSHELRTPLTSIRGALGLLEGGVVGDLSAEAREVVQIARSNSERLIRLINDLLDLEKIEAGRLELRLGEVSSREIVREALSGMKAVADGAAVRLERDVTAEATLRADLDRVVQVLVNLLSNAVKFSPRDSTVLLRTVPRDGRFRFEVVDHGPGIPEALRGKLFRKFQQLDGSDSRAKGGTGLGLSISKAIVEQMGGTIGLDSVVGQGTTFWFELPAAAVSANARASSNPPG
jgi:PAS domain S-box-containing protein